MADKHKIPMPSYMLDWSAEVEADFFDPSPKKKSKKGKQVETLETELASPEEAEQASKSDDPKKSGFSASSILQAVNRRRQENFSEISQSSAAQRLRNVDGLTVVEQNGYIAVGRENKLGYVADIPQGVTKADIDGFIDKVGSPWVRLPEVLTIGWEAIRTIDQDEVVLNPYFDVVRARMRKHQEDDYLKLLHGEMLRAFGLEPIHGVPISELDAE